MSRCRGCCEPTRSAPQVLNSGCPFLRARSEPAVTLWHRITWRVVDGPAVPALAERLAERWCLAPRSRDVCASSEFYVQAGL